MSKKCARGSLGNVFVFLHTIYFVIIIHAQYNPHKQKHVPLHAFCTVPMTVAGADRFQYSQHRDVFQSATLCLNND